MASGVASRFASRTFRHRFSSHVSRKLASEVAKSLASAREAGKPSAADLLASSISAKLFSREEGGAKDELPVASEDVGKA